MNALQHFTARTETAELLEAINASRAIVLPMGPSRAIGLTSDGLVLLTEGTKAFAGSLEYEFVPFRSIARASCDAIRDSRLASARIAVTRLQIEYQDYEGADGSVEIFGDDVEALSERAGGAGLRNAGLLITVIKALEKAGVKVKVSLEWERHPGRRSR